MSQRRKQTGRGKSSGRNTPARRDTAPVVPVVRSIVAERVEVNEHYGPLPPPDQLDEYDKRFPGLGERIIRMAELPLEMARDQMQHRQRQESKVISSDIRRSWAGLIVGAFLCMVALVGGIWLISEERSGEGLAAIVAALAAPLAALIATDRRRRNDLNRKNPHSES